MKKKFLGVILLCAIMSTAAFGGIFDFLKKKDKKANAANEKTVITWWGWYPTQEDFAVIEEGFEAKYPEYDLQASRFMIDDYINKLKLEFQSGKGPDIMSIQEGAFLAQFKPYLMNLEPEMGEWSKQIAPKVLEGAKRAGGDDNLYTVPLGMGGVMWVYYNATKFEEAGIKVPTNYDEYMMAIEKIKTAYPDKLTISIGLKDGWFAADFFNVMANQVSPGIVGKAEKGEVKWNDPKFVEAMELVQKLVAEGAIPKESVALAEYEDAIGLLSDGKALMHTNGSWNVGNLSREYGDRRKGRVTENDTFGAFILPNLAGGEPVALGGMDVGMGINKQSDKEVKVGAMKLIEYMTVGEGAAYFTGRAGSGLIPVKVGAQMNMEAYPDAASQAGAKNIVEGFANYFVGSREVSIPAIKNHMAVVLQNVINGADAKAELDELQKIYEREQ
jgi:ABC-type glycerol-3-phosphate transport system substrate-binding protein